MGLEPQPVGGRATLRNAEEPDPVTARWFRSFPRPVWELRPPPPRSRLCPPRAGTRCRYRTPTLNSRQLNRDWTAQLSWSSTSNSLSLHHHGCQHPRGSRAWQGHSRHAPLRNVQHHVVSSRSSASLAHPALGSHSTPGHSNADANSGRFHPRVDLVSHYALIPASPRSVSGPRRHSAHELHRLADEPSGRSVRTLSLAVLAPASQYISQSS